MHLPKNSPQKPPWILKFHFTDFCIFCPNKLIFCAISSLFQDFSFVGHFLENSRESWEHTWLWCSDIDTSKNEQNEACNAYASVFQCGIYVTLQIIVLGFQIFQFLLITVILKIVSVNIGPEEGDAMELFM